MPIGFLREGETQYLADEAGPRTVGALRMGRTLDGVRTFVGAQRLVRGLSFVCFASFVVIALVMTHFVISPWRVTCDFESKHRGRANLDRVALATNVRFQHIKPIGGSSSK